MKARSFLTHTDPFTMPLRWSARPPSRVECDRRTHVRRFIVGTVVGLLLVGLLTSLIVHNVGLPPPPYAALPPAGTPVTVDGMVQFKDLLIAMAGLVILSVIATLLRRGKALRDTFQQLRPLDLVGEACLNRLMSNVPGGEDYRQQLRGLNRPSLRFDLEVLRALKASEDWTVEVYT